MNDDDIIRQRISGKSVRVIAKTQLRSVTEINSVIDHWANVASQRNQLCLLLAVKYRRHGPCRPCASR
jgi:hypothetical protein